MEKMTLQEEKSRPKWAEIYDEFKMLAPDLMPNKQLHRTRSEEPVGDMSLKDNILAEEGGKPNLHHSKVENSDRHANKYSLSQKKQINKLHQSEATIKNGVTAETSESIINATLLREEFPEVAIMKKPGYKPQPLHEMRTTLQQKEVSPHTQISMSSDPFSNELSTDQKALAINSVSSSNEVLSFMSSSRNRKPELRVLDDPSFKKKPNEGETNYKGLFEVASPVRGSRR